MKKFINVFFIAVLLWSSMTVDAQPFADEIAAFKKQDSLHTPPSNPIVFAGSSSFRVWQNVQNDFPSHTIINRGFGGSTLPDVIRYAEATILKYHPKQVVIYCGENDIASSDTVTAQMVFTRFKTLFSIIRTAYKNLPIIFVSIKPSPSRAAMQDRMIEANTLIKKFLKLQKKAVFIDIYHLMLNADGTMKEELFVEDRLHMNAKGYAIWQKAIEPFLLKK